MKIDYINEIELDLTTKGVPGDSSPFKLSDIKHKNWNILKEDTAFPIMTLKESALKHNIASLQNYANENGVSLAPHGKTTMSPQIFKMQLDEGAWAMTAATVSQIQVYRNFGVNRIILANQLVGKQHLRYIINELNLYPEFEFYCLVDSVEQVNYLASQCEHERLKGKLNVLIELGVEGGRAGCRHKSVAKNVFTAINTHSKYLQFSGVECFEGIIPGITEESVGKVDEFLRYTSDCLLELDIANLSSPPPEIIISAGGSGFFDRVADNFNKIELSTPLRIVIRSGCYVTHDHVGYNKYQNLSKKMNRNWCEALTPSLEVFSYVQSTPEAGKAIITMGKRDAPYDASLPKPICRYRKNGQGELEKVNLSDSEVTALNDQHGFIKYENDDLAFGDIVCCGIAHPCTAFDKWQNIMLVDDDYNVTGAIQTYF